MFYRRRRTPPRFLTPDVYSEGTMHPEDVAGAILDAGDPRYLRMTRADRAAFAKLGREYNMLQDADADSFIGEYSNIADAATAILESYAAPYCYIGGHEGDGACIGCFVAYDSIQYGIAEGDIATGPVGRNGDCDGRDHATPEQPYALYCSDHGNMTLFRRVGRGRRWVEVW